MNNVIVGTAGHVDHGKTCLIKALTGIETDRLTEEKKRGITIELGFADMRDTGDQHVGIIDVPGHERFVRNMLAGIGGIDMVLLVVAADEGVMPQTVEHFEILKMLGIPKGIVVITKADLCDAEWMEIVRGDVKSTVAGTFLEKAPIIEVSSLTGQNLELLRETILSQAKGCKERRTDISLFRIPIDRVFTIDGFGTVITGTLMEGSVRVGDELEIFPSGKAAKVRTIQVHGKMVEQASAGQRTALNLAGLKKEDVSRGQVLAAKNSMDRTRMLDVRLNMFQDSQRTLRNGSRLHLYYGSAEILCKAVLLDREELLNGESCYAQLRLEEEIPVKKGDRFIVRFYSPVETIGGGTVLEASPSKHKRFDQEVLEAFKIKESGEQKQMLAQVVREESRRLLTSFEYGRKLGVTAKDAEKLLKELVCTGEIVEMSGGVYLHEDYVRLLKEKSGIILKAFHKENPVAAGMQKEEFRKKLSERLFLKDAKSADKLVKLLIEVGEIADLGNLISTAAFAVNFTGEQSVVKDRLEALYLKAGFNIPETEEAISSEKDEKMAKQVLDAMISQKILYRINYQYCMHMDFWNRALSILKSEIQKNGSITLAQFRDNLGTSRKYAVMLLEHLDEVKVTVKINDARVLY